jgi:hypothetical protein
VTSIFRRHYIPNRALALSRTENDCVSLRPDSIAAFLVLCSISANPELGVGRRVFASSYLKFLLPFLFSGELPSYFLIRTFYFILLVVHAHAPILSPHVSRGYDSDPC